MAHYIEKSMKERNSVNLPEKFLCRVCEKWKGKKQFSNKELDKFIYHTTQRGAKLTSITARLRCRGCAGGPAQELECLGPCAETKLLSAFSKSARQTGGSNWCTVCTLWKESSEHNVSVQPPPSGRSADTHAPLSSQLNDYEYSDPEVGDYDSDYDDISHISVSTAALEITPEYPETVSSPHHSSDEDMSQFTSRNKRYVNLNIIDRPGPSRRYNSAIKGNSSSVIGPESTEGDGSQTSVSNRWEDASFSTSASTLSQTMQPIPFNAWDPSGNRHLMNNQNAQSNETHVPATSNSRSAWARPFGSRNAGRVYQPDQPSQSNPRRK
ncbi:hypothetical protein GcM1_224085 [Golovinomyces cichoracearum]|uniref:Stc1 domain-containing protein n=1 Tax=Golovinomyces cichoracearum TaxID=62708 RepID=A0A420HD51_9PEZI|nr:hypothetical protein GcM3_202026 [Golovinomyces cichoracearum]RKF76881.1 hypothetical protein GcM1_224085 [Golovinomyces cichoracearum]RKF82965.1 hypothetical protein GcC1_008015 [Golovinomyces cichoracearum]